MKKFVIAIVGTSWAFVYKSERFGDFGAALNIEDACTFNTKAEAKLKADELILTGSSFKKYKILQIVGESK